MVVLCVFGCGEGKMTLSGFAVQPRGKFLVKYGMRDLYPRRSF
jgi:hypothetical protein